MRHLLSAMMLALVLEACGGAPPPPPHELASLRAMLARPKDPKAEGLAEAQALRAASEKAYAAGDLQLADALGSEGAARLLRAEALSRKEGAAQRLGQAERARREEEEAVHLLEDRIRDAELEGAELDRRISSLRDALAEQKEGPAPPERIAARRASARALLGEARLLCGAAALRGGNPRFQELEGLEAALTKIAPKTPKEASRASLELTHRALTARVDCLRLLASTRRGPGAATSTGGSGEIVAKLRERGWTARRDERGMILLPPLGFKLDAASDDLAALSGAPRVQVVRRTTEPRGAIDETTIRSAIRLPPSALRFETVQVAEGGDTYEFTLVD